MNVSEGRVLYVGSNLECSQWQLDAENWHVSVGKLYDTPDFEKASVVIVQEAVGSEPVVIKNSLGPVACRA